MSIGSKVSMMTRGSWHSRKGVVIEVKGEKVKVQWVDGTTSWVAEFRIGSKRTYLPGCTTKPATTTRK